MTQLLARFMPTDAAAHGPAIDRLNAAVHWLMLVLFVFWIAYFAVALWRFRAKRNPTASYAGMKSKWSSYSEAGVALFEAVLLIGFSIPFWRQWATSPRDGVHPLEVNVIAEQFAWNVQYPGADGRFGRRDVRLVTSTNPTGLDMTDPAAKDDVVVLNELHLEVDRPVIVHVMSKDVVHSFNLPVMRVKQDAIPGMEVPVHFTPVRTNNGEQWEIACAQLCGLAHYRMRGMLVVETKAELDAWLKSHAAEVRLGPIEAGGGSSALTSHSDAAEAAEWPKRAEESRRGKRQAEADRVPPPRFLAALRPFGAPAARNDTRHSLARDPHAFPETAESSAQPSAAHLQPIAQLQLRATEPRS